MTGRRDRSFGTTVLVGLGAGALAAVGASREWATSSGDAAGVAVNGSVTGSDAAPLVLALSLVALAAWGVVLVLRGRARQVGAVIGVLAAAGALVALVDAFDAAPDAAVTAATAQGATSDVLAGSLTAWYWTTGVALVLTLVTLGVAVLRARTWPSMGSRYDAPGSRPAAGAAAGSGPAAEPDERELWRAIDEGRDPTA
ncbi:Trp biosynthesis-associated membrane protein [Nocardioides mesophilus]|uniref:Trp biosynthesis-associated membrane protein n=1 Tax=Nocardioides mesophilus TaxID=433659 RepID=A0A7G9RBT7_9ACTN|nr:Trp biosynthesis-associated membrane protein [Nocardioides mesophilus]QNN53062.1 Trp biosynthesis-associated membrane protein [Nocardioides mesophilus]